MDYVLKQKGEAMDDLISRQWLMECVDEGWIKFDTEKDENKFIHLVRDIAPSAEPERKPGKWRRRLVDCGFNADWHCSECGWKTSLEEHGYNYCPNCGADMRGDDNA